MADKPKLPSERFEDAFDDGVGWSRVTCQCGQTYYNSDGGWDWEDGELEALRKDPKATDVDYSVSEMTVNGKTYVTGCPCTAELVRVENFIRAYRYKIAAYLKAVAEGQIESGEIAAYLKAVAEGQIESGVQILDALGEKAALESDAMKTRVKTALANKPPRGRLFDLGD
jgi:hypothetical protein